MIFFLGLYPGNICPLNININICIYNNYMFLFVVSINTYIIRYFHGLWVHHGISEEIAKNETIKEIRIYIKII
jgi:hypothetical protein